MKSLLFVFSLALAGSSQASEKSGKNADFDRLHENPRSAFSREVQVAALPPGEAKASKTTDTSADRPYPLIRVKDLLKDIPQEGRLEFLENLVLRDGVVVSASYRPLERYLTWERAQEILDQFSAPKGYPVRRKKNAPSELVRLAEVLEGVPQKERTAFLESMVFKSGALVSVSASGIEGAVSGKKLVQILNALGESGADTAEMGVKGLCGINWCEDAYCKSYGGRRFQCVAGEIICYSHCTDRDR